MTLKKFMANPKCWFHYYFKLVPAELKQIRLRKKMQKILDKYTDRVFYVKRYLPPCNLLCNNENVNCVHKDISCRDCERKYGRSYWDMVYGDEISTKCPEEAYINEVV